ncbi:hypothetical protein H0X06_04070 [Candidatus Dependentiae bacterium]|nr:hypothetical protein [Candidatus Dependentiae bacterium]
MNVYKIITVGLIALSSTSVVYPMNSTPKTLVSLTKETKKYVNLGQLFMNLGVLFASDSLEKNAFIPLLASVRYDKIHELFSIEKTVFYSFFNVKKLKDFFKNYTYTSPQSRLKKFISCIHLNVWENIFGCANFTTLTDLIVELYAYEGTVQEKNKLLDSVKTIITDIIKTSEKRKSSGIAESSIITTYCDCNSLLIIIDDMIAGNEISCERIFEILPCSKILSKCGIPCESVEPYVSLSHCLKLITSCANPYNTTDEPSFQSLFSCIQLDSIAELIAVNLFEDEVDLFISREKLKEVTRHLQAKKKITGTDVAAILQEEGLQQMLTDGEFDWDSCATYLNNLAQGIVHSFDTLPCDTLSKKLDIDIKNALDDSLPESIQIRKVGDIINLCTNTDWFMRCKYALPFVGIPLGLWLGGHAVCHSCMEYFEPQSWYTAGPLALGVLYGTFKGSNYFSTPDTMKTIITNAFVTKGLRLISYLQKETITKDDICHSVELDDVIVKQTFIEFIQSLSYAQLDTFTKNRCEILKIFENPIEFMLRNGTFLTNLFKKEATCTDDDFSKMLIRLYSILSTLVPEDVLPYNDSYTTFIECLNRACKIAVPHEMVLLIARYNPLLLLDQPDFLRALSSSKIHINSKPLSTVLLDIIYEYKEFIKEAL